MKKNKIKSKLKNQNSKIKTNSVLVLDNYDSFTYNLVQYLLELGASVVVKRNDEIAVDDIGKLGVDALIVSPGPCSPAEAGISVEAIKRYSGSMPILGVCLGHQAIGAAFGASIVRAASIMHGKTSEIDHDGLGVYKGLAHPFTATRYHSLCVAEETLPACLTVSSRVAGAGSAQGRPLGSRKGGPSEPIMGIRHKDHPTEGVQFHPESILTEAGHALLRNFLDLL